MTTTVIGLFGSTEEAKKAARAIQGTGHAKQEPQVMDAGAKDVGEELTGRGFDRETATRYARAVAKGPVLVLARVEDDEADAVAEAIDAQGALSLEEAEKKSGGKSEGTTLEVVQEEAEVRKQGVSQGAVRVSRHVTEKPFKETVTLRDRHVEVEERSVERGLSDAEARDAFAETTEEFVETGERAVVEKTAKVVGEVQVSQTVETHKETVEGTVRRADVEVERLQAAKGDRKAQR